MHFEILVEDASGELLLESMLPKILGELGNPHTWRTHAYRGIGRVPRDLKGKPDPSKRILLDRLPKVLAGYGRSLRGLDSAVVVVVDLDDRDCVRFKRELLQLLERCRPRPRALFRFAIEEMEAWLLGDRQAILKEFPRAKVYVLDSYLQDSICGTWEILADAVFPGGSLALKAAGWPRIGQEKCKWASQVGQHVSIEFNLSPSLDAFRSGVLTMSGAEA
ncbi:MAG TPA: hypothetical protein VMR62_16960 [Bryobacteraceae bacterium]|jgi:hypothetical protein|nr:hypothetical protein [Bryobacteraceae bacterium]